VVAGVLVGTAGLAGELAWVRLSGWAPVSTPTSMAVKVALLGPVAAVAAALLGAGLGRAFSAGGGGGGSGPGRDADRMPLAALVGAGVALVAVLAYPLPRNVGSVDAVIRTELVGDQAIVEVTLDPPDAAREATTFAVTSWQGGGRVTAFFDEIGPGRYRSDRAVPVTGSWKSMVSLKRGDEVMAAPVYLPADPSIGADEVPFAAERRTLFVRNTDLLLREKHSGAAWPAVAAWSGLSAMVALWVGLMAVLVRRIGGRSRLEPHRPSGLGPVTDWSTDRTAAPVARSLAPHAR